MTEELDFERQWLGKFASRLEETSGEEIRDEIMRGSESLTSQSDRSEVIEWSRAAMEKLDTRVAAELRTEIMTSCACQYPTADLVDARERYEETRDVDVAIRTLRERFEAFLNDTIELPREGASVARARYLLERGRTFNSAGSRERARPLFFEAFEVARAVENDRFAVDAAHMLGIVEEPEAAREWNHRALTLAEGSDDPRAREWLGSLYQNMGYNALQEERYDRALVLFERLIAWSRERGRDEQEEIGRWFVGRTYRAMGRDEEARRHFAAAYQRLSRDAWFAEAEPARLKRMKRLGGVAAE